MTVFGILCVCHIFIVSLCASRSSDNDIDIIPNFSASPISTPIYTTNDVSSTVSNIFNDTDRNVTLEELREYCCNQSDYKSLCTRKKCYFVVEEKSSFLTSRTSCTREYVRWERLADAATFQERSEFEEIQSLLFDGYTFWIGGISCPEVGRSESEFIETWFNGEAIPEWLNTTRSHDKANSCLFLTIEYHESKSRFKSETQKYMILCELKVPDASFQEETTLISTELTTTTSPFTSTQSELLSTTSSFISTTTSPSPSTIDESKGWCKERLHNGILWPSTQGGGQAKVKCPEGTIGTATWECDASTNQFISEPNMMECISVWFKEIQNEITSGKDVVDVANNLAEKIEANELKFGDLPEVINAMKLLNKTFDRAVGKRRKYGGAIVKVGSNLLNKRQKSSWNKLDKDIRLKSASNLLLQIQNIGTMISCKDEENSEDEDISSDNILLQSFIFKNKGPHIFPRTNNTINTMSYVRLPSEFVRLQSFATCRPFPTGYGVLYNGIGPHLSAQEKSKRRINSNIISFAYGEGHRSISLPTGKEVLISLKHIEDVENGEPQCVFWNFTALRWEDTGCWKVSGNQTHTQCKCSHLTNFAVLMDLSGNIRRSNDPVMKYLSIVCCGLSSIALIFTIACLIGFRASHSRRSTITCNLSFCLLTVNLLVLFGVKRTEIQIVCRIISGALHYSALTSFCWMLLEGYHLYQMVIIVFERINAIKLRWFCISAYGFPLLIVLPSVLLSPQSYGDSDACWLSARDNMIWVFAGPVAFILLINIAILIMALQSARNVKMKKQQTKAKNLLGWIKGSFSLMSLLGITWVVGFINIYEGVPQLAYIFIILNGLQGCFIMIFHIVINEKMRGCFIAFITRTQISGKGFRNSLQTTTSSRNPLHSQRRSESSKGSPMYFCNPRRISVSPASTTYTEHMSAHMRF